MRARPQRWVERTWGWHKKRLSNVTQIGVNEQSMRQKKIWKGVLGSREPAANREVCLKQRAVVVRGGSRIDLVAFEI
jgi:hypothetical protein